MKGLVRRHKAERGKTRSGKARNTSINRLVKVSVQPPMKPEMMPRLVDGHRQQGRQEGDQGDIQLPYTFG
jgi:hypothetical protein